MDFGTVEKGNEKKMVFSLDLVKKTLRRRYILLVAVNELELVAKW